MRQSEEQRNKTREYMYARAHISQRGREGGSGRGKGEGKREGEGGREVGRAGGREKRMAGEGGGWERGQRETNCVWFVE